MLGFPYNELLNRIPAKGRVFPKNLTQDVCAGIMYAFSTLEEKEQQVLLLLCGDQLEYGAAARQMNLPKETILALEKEAIRKLRLPGRWDFICHGVRGFVRMRMGQERDKAYQRGFMDGYRKSGQNVVALAPDVENMPVENMGLSYRSLTCLKIAGITTVGELAKKSEEEIRRMRNVGPVTIAELSNALWKQGIYALWDTQHMQEE